MKWECNDIFGGDITLKLEPGVFCDDAEYAFSHGHCHTFAVALQKLVGGEIIAAEWEDWSEEGRVTPNHVAVRAYGIIYDAYGVHEIDDRYSDWKTVTLDEIEQWISDREYRPFKIDDAASFADAFCANYGLEINA